MFWNMRAAWWSKTRPRSHVGWIGNPEMTIVGWSVQNGSGWNDWISSCRATQKPSVGVWHGPNEIRFESRSPYRSRKYSVWYLVNATPTCVVFHVHSQGRQRC